MNKTSNITKIMLAGTLFLWGALPACAEYPYPYEVTDEDNKVISHTVLDIDFDFIELAVLTNEIQFALPAKTLLIRFKTPQTILSTLDGWKNDVHAVGNHYNPPEAWDTAHELGLAEMNRQTQEYLGLSPAHASLMFTGVNVANYAYKELTEKQGNDELRVGVFTTAGVTSNAMRAGFDSGDFWEPGTINLIILTNRKLTPAAMGRIIITATEAKTAALEDLDIRSSYSGQPATGTGTDNIIVIGGSGSPANLAGGHTRLGEFTAKLVYETVTQAIAKQNGLVAERSVIERLKERGIDLEALKMLPEFTRNDAQKRKLTAELKKLLEDPYFSSFLASFLAIADADECNLISPNKPGSLGSSLNTSLAYADWCLRAASKTAGMPITDYKPIIEDQKISPVVRLALDALLTGLIKRNETEF